MSMRIGGQDRSRVYEELGEVRQARWGQILFNIGSQREDRLEFLSLCFLNLKLFINMDYFFGNLVLYKYLGVNYFLIGVLK